MTIIERVSTLVRADINDLIDQAEDPERLLEQLPLDMHSQLLQARIQVAAAIADQKLLHERYQDNQARAATWRHRAELAAHAAEDDLARHALMRRSAFQQTADDFKQQYAEQSGQIDVLKEALARLEEKIAEVETTKNLLSARGGRARAKTEIHSPVVVLDDCGALYDFEHLKHTVDEMEARAAALRELDSDSIDQRHTRLATAWQVERELAALKASKVLVAPAEPALRAG